MKYKMFVGSGEELEKKISDWLTPNTEIVQLGQSSVNALGTEKHGPITIISVFYRIHGVPEQRSLD